MPALTAPASGERLFADKSFFPFCTISKPRIKNTRALRSAVAAMRLIVTVKQLESLE